MPLKSGHLAKAPADLLKRRIRQRTNELIAAEAHDQVIGAQAGSQRIGGSDQQSISGEVIHHVVDLLQAVDIDKRDYKPFANSASTLQLTLELFHTRSAPSDMRQLIDLRRLAVKRRLNPIALPGRETPRPRHIQTSTRVPNSHLSRMLTSRPDAATCLRTGAPRQFLIAGNLILIRSQLITVGGRLILIRRRQIPIGGRLITLRGRLIFIGSHPI
jgi:hypothetical protein